MRKGPGSVYDKWNISWSFVTQIFHNGQPSHGGDRKIFKVMTSTLPKRKYIIYNVQGYIVGYMNTLIPVGIILACGKH